MEIRKQLGTLVRAHRKNRGWTQEELAFEAGRDRSYVSGLERGVRNPTIEVLHSLASAMDLTVSELVEGLPIRD